MVPCLFAIGALLSGAVTGRAAERLPTPDETLASMRLVNDWFMPRWPDPAAPVTTDRTRPSSFWVRAVYYEGLMALHRVAPEPRFYDYAVAWGEGNNWTLWNGTTDRNADNQCCGQTYIDLYLLDPQPVRLAAIRAAIDNMVSSTKVDDWWWIDALQMAMPVFAKLGVLTGDARYFEKMFELYNHTRRVEGGSGLYNTADHLWWRDKDFDPPYTEPNGEDCYWARGNGWVFCALARVLDVLPTNAPHRDEYLQTFQEMAAAIAACQREDGFWNASLHDPSHYGGREFSGTAFFTYGLAWGIRSGLLERAAYLPAVIKGWRALAEDAVHPASGFPGYMQGTGKQPSDGQPVTYATVPNYEDYAVGAFLLAGSEVWRLATHTEVQAAGAFKTRLFRQTAAGTAEPDGATPCRFEAAVEGTSLTATTVPGPWTATLPGAAGTLSLNDGDAPHALRREVAAASAGALATQAPNGVVTLSLGTATPKTLQLGAGAGGVDDAFPDVVPATASAGTWSAGVLRVPVSSVLVLTSGGFGTSFAAGLSRLELSIEGCRLAAECWVTSADDGVSLLVPANALTAGRTYTVRVVREQLTSRADAVAWGALGSSVQVRAGFRTVTTFPLEIAPAAVVLERKFVNIATRGWVGSGNDVLIAGFVVAGTGPKIVLVRAAGPALQPYLGSGFLADPYLRVYNANSTRVWQNNDWQRSSQVLARDATSGATTLQASFANVRAAATAAGTTGAFAFGSGSRDAALVLCLSPGAYTAHVSSNTTGSSGVALAEVYEFDLAQQQPRLVNLSTRGRGRTGHEIMIAGFVVQGGPKRILLRAVGPTLANYGLPAGSVLADPRLQLFDETGRILAENDNWETVADPLAQTTLRTALGAFPLPPGSRDAEMTVVLEPGRYTVHAFGADGGTGIVLLEAYEDTTGW